MKHPGGSKSEMLRGAQNDNHESFDGFFVRQTPGELDEPGQGRGASSMPPGLDGKILGWFRFSSKNPLYPW